MLIIDPMQGSVASTYGGYKKKSVLPITSEPTMCFIGFLGNQSDINFSHAYLYKQDILTLETLDLNLAVV